MQLTKAAIFLDTNCDVDYSLITVQAVKLAGEEIFVSTRHYTYPDRESGLVLTGKKLNVPLEEILSEAPKSHSQNSP